MTKLDEVYQRLALPKELSFVRDNLLYMVLAGSHAYGTNTAESDEDFRGVCIAPLRYYMTNQGFEQREDKTNDITVYSINKFFQLASEVNPNIIELLFIDPKEAVYVHPLMEEILKKKDMFLSRKAEHTFLGYAYAQLQRIRTHKKWLDKPLTQPKREDFGLEPVPRIAHEKIKAFYTLGADCYNMVGSDFGDYLRREDAFNTAQSSWDKYNGWQKSRNPKRFELEKAYSYDVKHGMHLCRLLCMAEEIAVERTIKVRRPDAEFLLDIRNGKFTYEEILQWAADKEARVKAAFERSSLPWGVNHEAINSLLENTLRSFFGI